MLLYVHRNRRLRTGAQDGYFDFHTAPELCSSNACTDDVVGNLVWEPGGEGGGRRGGGGGSGGDAPEISLTYADLVGGLQVETFFRDEIGGWREGRERMWL